MATTNFEKQIQTIILDEGVEKPPMLRKTHPYPAIDYTLRESAAALGLNEADWREVEIPARQTLQLADKASFPVIGVLGMINSGKSSTVRSFLSSSGRERVLTGEQSHEGTQRFVFWFPGRLREDREFRNVFGETCLQVFGKDPEDLEAQPEKARLQYNATGSDASRAEKFEVPLIAFDDQLNQLGFGFLDCPDIQRAHPDGGTDDGVNLEDRRLHFVGRAAQLCSAICFVSKPDTIEDHRAATAARKIDEQMPGIPKLVLVNQVKPQRWDDGSISKLVCEHLAPAMPVEAIFLAYDFDIPNGVQKTPEPLRKGFDRDGDPVFFNVQTDSSPVGLGGFVAGFDPQKLAEAVTRSHRARLSDAVNHFRRLLTESYQETNQLSSKLRDVLLELCRDASVDDKLRARIPITEEVARELYESIQRTAPLLAKPAVWMAKVTGGEKRLSKKSKRELEAVRLTPEVLADQTRRRFGIIDDPDKWGSEKHLLESWRSVLTRARQHLPKTLDQRKLDSAMKDLWQKAGKKYRGPLAIGGAIVLLATIALVIFAPIGAAGLAVIGQASVVEIAAALSTIPLAGGLAAVLETSSLFRYLREAIFPTAFANLFSFACDAFGLPREIDGKQTEIEFNDEDGKKVKMKVDPSKESTQSPLRWVPSPGYWVEVPENWQELMNLLSSNPDHNVS